MSEQVRPEVVRALMDSQLDLDPTMLAGIPQPTAAEFARADAGVLEVYRAKSNDEDRRVEVWEILASTRFAARGLSWEQIWAELSDAERRHLSGEYFDVLPEPLVLIATEYRGSAGQ